MPNEVAAAAAKSMHTDQVPATKPDGVVVEAREKVNCANVASTVNEASEETVERAFAEAAVAVQVVENSRRTARIVAGTDVRSAMPVTVINVAVDWASSESGEKELAVAVEKKEKHETKRARPNK